MNSDPAYQTTPTPDTTDEQLVTRREMREWKRFINKDLAGLRRRLDLLDEVLIRLSKHLRGGEKEGTDANA